MEIVLKKTSRVIFKRPPEAGNQNTCGKEH